jgi:hypothetical protein
MKSKLFAVGILAALAVAGCTLPVPKTAISYDPASKTVQIASPKDVQIEKVDLQLQGTNFTLSIAGYQSQNNIEVVKAAVQAQANQIAASMAALKEVAAAAAPGK